MSEVRKGSAMLYIDGRLVNVFSSLEAAQNAAVPQRSRAAIKIEFTEVGATKTVFYRLDKDAENWSVNTNVEPD